MNKEQILKSRQILNDVADKIEANPKRYDQHNWCGTNCCIAGHIVFNAGAKRIKYEDSNVKFKNEVCDVSDLAIRLLMNGDRISNIDIIYNLFKSNPSFYWRPKWAKQWDKAATREEQAKIAADYIRKYIIPKAFPLRKK